MISLWLIIYLLQELTLRAQDSLVSFGERLSTRIFAALLHKQASSLCDLADGLLSLPASGPACMPQCCTELPIT